uniref:Histone deacetylase 14 n=1 Tax=Tanacetum cinerariifolium TaxID=118510 RepID=A0A699H168_TANCI|nr:histone deacetylase 14 [Tanacetum cinerariifolium]
MANENVPALAPTRSDNQILPFAAWVSIGKSNFILDLQEKQKNPIFQIYVDILQNTNFFRAFTSSASLDEDWFRLDANLVREALEITPVDQTHQFMLPHLGDAIMDFVNHPGYPGEIHFVSRMAMNNLYQSWRAILLMINQCLTGKTSKFDRPKYPVFQMLWGIITRTNIDHAELMWEEFVQVIQTFLVDKENLGSHTKKGKKTKPHVIPYSQFTKLIIYYLGRHHNIHQRSGSPLNLAEDDLSLRNLKFVPKGKIIKVFGMKIPEELITDNIRNAPYYNAYLEMFAKHKRRIAAAKEGDEEQDQPEAVPEPQGAEATRPLYVVEGKGKATATEEQAAQSLLALHTPKKRSTMDQFIFQRRTPTTKDASTEPSAQPQDDTSANIVCETPSPADAKTGADTDKVISENDTEILNIGKEQGEDVDNQGYLEEQTAILDKGQAR